MTRRCGFTLIELLVVLAIVALLATLALPRYFRSIDAARETVLIENLRVTRDAIDKFHNDTRRYPGSIGELVDKQYLKTAPLDPFNKSSDSWIIVPAPDPAQPGVYDLHSGAPGLRQDGTPLSSL